MRNSSRRSVLACTAISLLARGLIAAQPAPARPPAIALVDEADLAQWHAWSKDSGWRIITAAGPPQKTFDLRVKALEAAVLDAVKTSVDPSRVYLAGRGEASAAVFYTVSRVPDLWAAAVAIGGSPQSAIDTNRLYAANFTLAPVLWIVPGKEDQATASKLLAAGMNLEARLSEGLTTGALFQWLAGHARDEFPDAIDCETGSPSFPRCYWIEMTKFDPGERNDVLPSSRLQPGSGAALDLGGFGFKLDDPGPGVLVSWLPDKYSGQLKLNDRLVSLNGKEIKDGRQYVEILAKTFEEAAATVMVARGKDRIRVETRIVLPRREETATARIQARHIPEDKELQVVSRTVTEMRVNVPAHWVPSLLSWNGTPLQQLEQPGCVLLTMLKSIPSAKPCP